MTYFVGIDVGGSKSAAALIDETGSTLARDWAEHADGYADALVDVMLSSAHRLLVKASLRPDEVAAFGVAVAGLVSSDRSTLVRAPTLGETRLDLGSRSAERLGRPVVVINDANATLYGHALHTAHGGAPLGGETHVSVLFTLGTGIGGSIMLGETIVVGEHGFASELGHVVVDFADQRLCLCGGKGCVEQFASGLGTAATHDGRGQQSQERGGSAGHKNDAPDAGLDDQLGGVSVIQASTGLGVLPLGDHAQR